MFHGVCIISCVSGVIEPVMVSGEEKGKYGRQM